jgi:hypothetical protein
MSKASRGPFDKPLKVVRVDGEVVVLGPAHMHGAFTAEAARLTAAMLVEMAEERAQDDRPDGTPDGTDGEAGG